MYVASARHHRIYINMLPSAGLRRIHLHVPAGAASIRIMHEHMPCLTDIRLDSSGPACLNAEMFLAASTQSHHTFGLVHAG
jgi:hypothetical protein